MLRRVLNAFTLLFLIGSAIAIVSSREADAVNHCDPVVEPFVVRDEGFNPFFTGSHVLASDLIEFASGDIERATNDATEIASLEFLPPGIRPFYEDAVEWLNFKASNRCANLVAYLVIENMPEGSVTPYGFNDNPTAALPAPSFVDTPAAVGVDTPTAAASAPAVAAVAVDAPTSASVPAPAIAARTQLAHTGSETDFLLSFGVGLLGFGALALGGQRRTRKPFA